MDKHNHISDIEKFFIDFLATKKLRLTTQRKIIFNELITRKTHTDIDELFIKMKSIDKNIGLATVYRTLRLLTEAGIVREVKIGSDKPVYEAIIGREHHDHLVCSKCGENIEFKDEKLEAIQEDIASKYNYKLTGHSMYLVGVCANCRDK